jgi:hypothetical protein
MAVGFDDITLRTAAVPVTRWRIGDVSVTKIAETEMIRSVAASLPNADPRRLSELPWPTGAFAVGDGNVAFSFHSFVIETRSRSIVVDTCFGNGTKRPGLGYCDSQPGSQVLPVRGRDLPPHHLPRHRVEVVEGQLLPVNIQSAYDGHRDLLKLPKGATSAPRTRMSLAFLSSRN